MFLILGLFKNIWKKNKKIFSVVHDCDLSWLCIYLWKKFLAATFPQIQTIIRRINLFTNKLINNSINYWLIIRRPFIVLSKQEHKTDFRAYPMILESSSSSRLILDFVCQTHKGYLRNRRIIRDWICKQWIYGVKQTWIPQESLRIILKITALSSNKIFLVWASGELVSSCLFDVTE